MTDISEQRIDELNCEHLDKKIDDLETILHHREKSLAFPGEYEASFQHHYSEKFNTHMRNALMFGAVMFLLSYIFDYTFLPEVQKTLLIRIGVVVPVFSLLVIFALSRWYEKYQQASLIISSVLLSLGLVAIAHHVPTPMRLMYINGLMLVMIYAFSYTRLFFWNAVKFACFAFALLNFFLYFEVETTMFAFLAHNYIFICGCILLLVNNYAMEYTERQEYLQDVIIQLEKNQLEKMNQHLHDLANIDGLTELANFRHFDVNLKTEWRRALRYQFPIAVMMLDFDNFKTLNDSYGHQVGDECLRQLAETISKFSRRPGDMTGRYGGDEFIMMLVDSDLESTKKIAEKIRLAIAELRLANENSDVAPFVTTTIGVAAITPSFEMTTDDLIKCADLALYEAKHSGRNCVRGYTDYDAIRQTA